MAPDDVPSRAGHLRVRCNGARRRIGPRPIRRDPAHHRRGRWLGQRRARSAAGCSCRAGSPTSARPPAAPWSSTPPAHTCRAASRASTAASTPSSRTGSAAGWWSAASPESTASRRRASPASGRIARSIRGIASTPTVRSGSAHCSWARLPRRRLHVHQRRAASVAWRRSTPPPARCRRSPRHSIPGDGRLSRSQSRQSASTPVGGATPRPEAACGDSTPAAGRRCSSDLGWSAPLRPRVRASTSAASAPSGRYGPWIP